MIFELYCIVCCYLLILHYNFWSFTKQQGYEDFVRENGKEIQRLHMALKLQAFGTSDAFKAYKAFRRLGAAFRKFPPDYIDAVCREDKL